MRKRIWLLLGTALVLAWVATDSFAGRGGGRGGGGGARGGGGRPGGGYAGGRPGGGMPGGARPGGMPGGVRPGGGFQGGARPGGMPAGGGRPPVNRTPSFSPAGGGGRPGQLPANRPQFQPGGGIQRPGGGNIRPDIAPRPGQLPGGNIRPGQGANRPSLPSTRPDIGGRPGIAGRPGATLPGIGAGAAAGAGIGNRIGDRPGTLPGLDNRPGIGQRPGNLTPAQRRDALQDRFNGGMRPEQLPARDWSRQRQNWQDRRDDIRNDWQDHRDNAREDWQNWFGDHYPRYGGWYGGFAPGYWNRWDYMWDSYPVAAAMGLTWWGVNTLGYQFGYSDYVNPYYSEGMPVYCAAPIISAPAEVESSATVEPAATAASSKFDDARAAFFDGKYDDALKLTDAAIALTPNDAVLHEFRSLVLFALQRYKESAAEIHSVLDVGPGWDWKTLIGLYSHSDVYTNQLRALESAYDKEPKSAAIRFLLGYHYLTCYHQESALKMFKQALELQPNDTVAASLVRMLSPASAPSQPTPASPAPAAVPPDSVVGKWQASGPNSSSYAMTLNKDGTFVWSFTKGTRKDEAKGVFTIDGNVLAMEPDSGGVLLAELTMNSADDLTFKMVGGAKDDAGLSFRRSGKN